MSSWFKKSESQPVRPGDPEQSVPFQDAKYPSKLSPEFSGALRTFSFWIANGSVGHPLLEGVEYRDALMSEPSLMEQAYAIFVNVIELDESGMPTNAKYAEHRAAQYIRSYVQADYEVSPPFESWEQELYAPPGVSDPKPWPKSEA